MSEVSLQVVAAIVTCGGLCPGLNNVVAAITDCLLKSYGSPLISTPQTLPPTPTPFYTLPHPITPVHTLPRPSKPFHTLPHPRLLKSYGCPLISVGISLQFSTSILKPVIAIECSYRRQSITQNEIKTHLWPN